MVSELKLLGEETKKHFMSTVVGRLHGPAATLRLVDVEILAISRRSKVRARERRRERVQQSIGDVPTRGARGKMLPALTWLTHVDTYIILARAHLGLPWFAG